MNRRIAAFGALLLTGALLTACSQAPRGGAEQLPTAAPAATFTEAADGMRAPGFSAPLVDGTPVTLEELSGDRVLVLQFTASWCTQCVDAEPELSQIAEDYAGAVLPVRIALNEPVEDIVEYLRDTKAVGPAVIDASGKIWRDYAVGEPPLTAVIDAQGSLTRMWPGGADATTLRATLDELVTLN